MPAICGSIEHPDSCSAGSSECDPQDGGVLVKGAWEFYCPTDGWRLNGCVARFARRPCLQRVLQAKGLCWALGMMQFCVPQNTALDPNHFDGHGSGYFFHVWMHIEICGMSWFPPGSHWEGIHQRWLFQVRQIFHTLVYRRVFDLSSRNGLKHGSKLSIHSPFGDRWVDLLWSMGALLSSHTPNVPVFWPRTFATAGLVTMPMTQNLDGPNGWWRQMSQAQKGGTTEELQKLQAQIFPHCVHTEGFLR